MESDLDELLDDELTNRFNKAANHLQNIVARLDQDTLLKFYAFYKQGSQGACNIPKPGFFNINGRAKWEAWNSLGDLSKEEAQTAYVSLLASVDPAFETPADAFGHRVRVSTMLATECELQEFEKSIVDHVKNGTITKVEQYFKQLKDKDRKEVLSNLDESGLGLIHWAADRGVADVLKLLVAYGVDVNLRDEGKQTALHYAASCGHVRCVQELLKAHVDVNVRDEDGLTAKDLASDESIVALLNM